VTNVSSENLHAGSELSECQRLGKDVTCVIERPNVLRDDFIFLQHYDCTD